MDDPGRSRLRRVLVVGGIVLLVLLVSGTALYRSKQDARAADLTVVWGGSEGHPCCVYDPATRIVEATVVIDGSAPRDGTVTVTVTAYADENTSEPVGSTTRSVPVEGTVHRLPVVLSIPVDAAPHVDDDGIVACRLSVDD